MKYNEMTYDEYVYSLEVSQLIKDGYRNGLILPFEQEVFDKLENVFYCGFPASILIKHKELCKNKCHERSMLLLAAFDECQLVNGDTMMHKISNGADGAAHGWVEKDGWCYDTSVGAKIKKELYYEMYKPFNIKTYSKAIYEKTEHYKNRVTSKLNPDALILIIPLIEEQAHKESNNEIKNDVKELKLKYNYDGLYQQLKQEIISRNR